ncbi:MAG: MerR family transcriptional regulator [Defluviitaleaceae bacterium]|nr:MerR family transcriptional regulator [Defluviitaleaceae bacterium]MCL2274531.1 MerR family transcriptional regulator [Defluviitaleaceae bacterium]
MDERMGIHEAAKLYGISARTLRYYEEAGLLTSFRKNDARYREYDRSQCKRLEVVLLLRRLSFSVKEIAELFEAGDADLHALLRQKISASDAILREAAETNSLLKSLATALKTHPIPALNVDALLSKYIYLTHKTERMVRVNTTEERYMLTIGAELIPMAQPLVDGVTALRTKLESEKTSLPPVRIIDDIHIAPNEAVLYYDNKEFYRTQHNAQDAFVKEVIDQLESHVKSNA